MFFQDERKMENLHISNPVNPVHFLLTSMLNLGIVADEISRNFRQASQIGIAQSHTWMAAWKR